MKTTKIIKKKYNDVKKTWAQSLDSNSNSESETESGSSKGWAKNK